MSPLSAEHVATIAAFLTGKRLERFQTSVAFLNASIDAGDWTLPRGRGRADKGFYQGIASHVERGVHFELYMALKFGQAPQETFAPAAYADCGVPEHVARAWVALCKEKRAAADALDSARPKPMCTPIKLSPRVTKTLTECQLDLDLSTVRPADIGSKEVQARGEDGKLAFNKRGEPIMTRVYFPLWTFGIKHGLSRFAHTGGCEACGKHIPSGRFVAVEASCKRHGLISLWLGCDCARNIFGVKDVGLDRT